MVANLWTISNYFINCILFMVYTLNKQTRCCFQTMAMFSTGIQEPIEFIVRRCILLGIDHNSKRLMTQSKWAIKTCSTICVDMAFFFDAIQVLKFCCVKIHTLLTAHTGQFFPILNTNQEIPDSSIFGDILFCTSIHMKS